MPVRASFDGRRAALAYGAAFRRLADLPGFNGQTIVLAETGVILKAWAGRTSVATQAQVDLRTRVRVVRDLDLTGGKRNREASISVNAGLRGPFGRVFMRKRDGTGWRRTHEAGFRPIWQHYKRGDWIDLQEAVADVRLGIQREQPRGRRSIGFARQSVVQIADSLGIDLGRVAGGGLSGAGLAKARASMASNGRSYRNGFGIMGGGRLNPVAMIFNVLPYNARIGMDRTLAGVLFGRARFIDRAWVHGTFSSLRATARAFPNLIRVTGGPAL
jgi:hypothetical protein